MGSTFLERRRLRISATMLVSTGTTAYDFYRPFGTGCGDSCRKNTAMPVEWTRSVAPGSADMFDMAHVPNAVIEQWSIEDQPTLPCS